MQPLHINARDVASVSGVDLSTALEYTIRDRVSSSCMVPPRITKPCRLRRPQLFNAQGQTPGYETIEEIIVAHASGTALEIGNELVLMSERWLDGRDASDDVTFAVIKVV